METNDSEATNLTSLEDPSSNRYSKRVRKPIQLYLPEIVRSKTKKHEYDVSCEILKSKGFSALPKNLIFSVGANLSTFNVVKKFLRKARCEIPECRFIYFSEESQSIIYLAWKRLKSTKVLEPGLTYKIRAYKFKKMEKKNLGHIKKNDKKVVQNSKPNNPANPPSEAAIQNMVMWNMYMAMMCMNSMNMPAYHYYPPY